MCYSFQTSIFSYCIGMLSSIFAMCTNQITIGFLILFYTQMQLAEALIWKGIDTDNVHLNKIGTAIAKYSLRRGQTANPRGTDHVATRANVIVTI